MKREGILNGPLSEVVAAIGHWQMLVVADAGLPIPPEVRRIDLAVSRGIPGTLQVVEAIRSEMPLEKLIIAGEADQRNPAFVQGLSALFPGLPMERLPHVDFKKLTLSAVCVVRTGECTKNANVILVAGVAF